MSNSYLVRYEQFEDGNHGWSLNESDRTTVVSRLKSQQEGGAVKDAYRILLEKGLSDAEIADSLLMNNGHVDMELRNCFVLHNKVSDTYAAGMFCFASFDDAWIIQAGQPRFIDASPENGLVELPLLEVARSFASAQINALEYERAIATLGESW